MSTMSLAVKYRPQTFDDVTEQGSVKTILKQQIASGDIKHSYLFCGGAGTGKTTTARIFANEINEGIGQPLEIDAASNNSVDNVRSIIQQSRMATLDGSKYRIFIIDECHSLSNQAWQAMLKLLEEPPASAVFIFCTTDPQKIPKTILSRVQRYDFQRISQNGIIKRLHYICNEECICPPMVGPGTPYGDALEYIAKMADGGMRDAITLMDKCLSYSETLTVENVVSAIGTVDYEVMLSLTDNIVLGNCKETLEIIERLHNQGKDLKLFIKNYTNFVLDICKYAVMKTLTYTQLPNYYEEELKKCNDTYFSTCKQLLQLLLRLNTDIKWDNSPKAMVEANLYGFCLGE